MKIRTAILAILAALAVTPAARAASAPTEPVYTNKPRFRIPYRYDPLEMQKLAAREIRLYTSADRGQQWQLAQAVDPRNRKFEFEAAGEGEYWFAVRTVDAQNQLHPPGDVVEPGLIVVVDTTSPTFELALSQPNASHVELTWDAHDTNLDLSTLRLEYIQTGASEWQSVDAAPQVSGRTSWPAPQGGVVAVRGTVSDLAGNSQAAQAQVQIAAPTPGAPRPPVPDMSGPIAAGQRNDLAVTGPASPQIPIAGSSVHAVPPMPAEQRTVAVPLTNVSNQAANRPEILQDRYPQPTQPQPAQPQPIQGDATNQVVNARHFQVGYQVDEVGPSGVKSVELYITEDGGRQWFKYGNDSDVTSPFPVEVPRDGLYGFAIRVRSGVGLVADPPYPGERPSVNVLVDTTPPAISLMPHQQGHGPMLNKVTIRWRMTDQNPGQQPILLSFAGDASGPWTPIGSWQADTGSFAWTIGAGVPSRLFIRVTARDAAGNITHMDTPEPILIDLTRPTARIVNIEPIVPGL